MKNQWFKMRISQRRIDRLRLYAATYDKTMTQVVEELIDSLPSKKIGDSDAGVPANASLREAPPTLSSTPCPVKPTV